MACIAWKAREPALILASLNAILMFEDAKACTSAATRAPKDMAV